MKYKAIFFDWDGVITDSVNIKAEAFYELFVDFGVQVQNKVKEHHLNNGGMSRFEKFKFYYKEFLKTKINSKKIDELSAKFSALVKNKVANSQFIAGAVETIKKEYDKNVTLFIVSGTPTSEIQEIAEIKNLDKYFKEICGSPRKKTEWVVILLKKYNLIAKDCLFIGDAMVDYTAAKNTKVNFLGIKIDSCKTEFPQGTTIKKKVEIDN